MFDWLKRLIRKEPVEEPKTEPNRQEKPCRACGKPVYYNPSWKHIPNYCRDCNRMFAEQRKQRTYVAAPAPNQPTRTCIACKKQFFYNPAWKHVPDLCYDCKEKIHGHKRVGKDHADRIKVTCKDCGRVFTVPRNTEFPPNYCRACKERYQQRNPQIILRECKECGKQFAFPSTVKHYPNYCKECRMKFRYGR